MSSMELNHSPPVKKQFDRRLSFRDIQGAITRMNPEIVKSVIQSESGKRPLADENMSTTTAPLTIFYNGIVSVFHVTPLQAEIVMKIGNGEETPATYSKYQQLSTVKQDEEKLVSDESYTDLPIARKKSLQRFLQKRKGRVEFSE